MRSELYPLYTSLRSFDRFGTDLSQYMHFMYWTARLFFALFMLIFLFLKHAEEFRRQPASSALGRDYSRHGRWVMREFNELPHVFEARLAASTADASAYVRQFPAPLTTLIARFDLRFD